MTKNIHIISWSKFDWVEMNHLCYSWLTYIKPLMRLTNQTILKPLVQNVGRISAGFWWQALLFHHASVWECSRKKARGMMLIFLNDGWHGDDVSVRLLTALRLSDALFSTLIHLITHTHETLTHKHSKRRSDAEIHAQHLQIQCCGAFRHSSHGLNERWAFRIRRIWWCFKRC